MTVVDLRESLIQKPNILIFQPLRIREPEDIDTITDPEVSADTSKFNRDIAYFIITTMWDCVRWTHLSGILYIDAWPPLVKPPPGM